VARMIEILARGKWLPQLRRYEAAMPTEIPLDTIDNVLSHVASAARCWEVNPSIYNDRYLTQLVDMLRRPSRAPTRRQRSRSDNSNTSHQTA
jgi:hypothetical protein